MNYGEKCDRCGHQAKQCWLKGKDELFLCNHHGIENATQLVRDGWRTKHASSRKTR